jgi:long-chain acyl-CoA synthetase
VATIDAFSARAAFRPEVFPGARPPAQRQDGPLGSGTDGANGAAVVAELTAPPDEEARFERLLAELPLTLAGLFRHRVRVDGDREAFRSPAADGGWTSWTWSECDVVVTELAAGLLSLGVRAGEPVAIASSTRLEWVLADLAMSCVGAPLTTVDPATHPDDVGFVLADSGARVVVAEDARQLARVRDHWGRLPDLLAVVVLDEDAVGPGSPHVDDSRVLSAAALRRRGRMLLATEPDAVERAVAAVRPDQLASVLYTAGTTGRPKGVRHSHAAWVRAAVAGAATGLLTEDDVQYLWAPLSHSFGKALLATQLVVGFASAVCGDPGRLVEGMRQVRPTVVAGPPRLFQRVHARALAELETAGPGHRWLARRALAVGRRAATARSARRRPSPTSLAALAVADRLVLRRVREHFGGRVRYLLCGTASLGQDVAEWFAAAGLPVLEGYGLTETTTTAVLARPGARRPGTVGRPLPGAGVRLTADGLVHVRGPGLMRGYQNRLDDTARVTSAGGWVSTGDTGQVVDGCLQLTGRLRDVVTTSAGTRVAPEHVEQRLSALCPYVSHVVVVGDGRPWLAALVTLDADTIATWACSTGLAGCRYDEVVASEQVRAMVAACVSTLNADCDPAHRLHDFAILPRDLTVADGELTPALVPRREVVERRWAAVVDGLYAP